MPDIFVNGGATDFANWTGLLEDMSDQAWASDTDAAYVDENGTIGFPYTTEAVGLAYNADILEQAGIDPSTLTSPSAIQAAFETLDSQKDSLGLTAVVGYCAEVASLYWSTGNHLFANYLDGGLDRDDTTYIDMLNDGGQLDTDRLTKFAEFVDLLNQYSDPALLVSGTYDQQILNFASGKYAFVTQGSWIGATMTSSDADAYAEAGNFKCGMIPYAFEDGMDTILTNSPSWWAVYKDGNTEAAKAFLQWCSEDEAQKVLVEEAGFVSPFKSCQYVASDPFAQTIVDYQNSGKTSSWHWLSMKEGLAQNYTGQVFGDFAAGNLDVASFVTTMQQVCQAAYAS
jgi:raffinose/stachyose/melibiose transport system substrate-binding protein